MDMSDRDFLAMKQSDGYSAYMKSFMEVSWNKILIPVWFCKDNAILFIRIFWATLAFMIFYQYITDIYTQFNLGTQAGYAAFLVIKVYFTLKIVNFLIPSDIVGDIKASASRLSELWETKKWLKKPESKLASAPSTPENVKTPYDQSDLLDSQ